MRTTLGLIGPGSSASSHVHSWLSAGCFASPSIVHFLTEMAGMRPEQRQNHFILFIFAQAMCSGRRPIVELSLFRVRVVFCCFKPTHPINDAERFIRRCPFPGAQQGVDGGVATNSCTTLTYSSSIVGCLLESWRRANNRASRQPAVVSDFLWIHEIL